MTPPPDLTPSTFYNNKHVVVTGGAGFVGSHLVDLLIEVGAHVTVIDNLSRGKPVPSMFSSNPHVTFVYSDVGNEGTCRDNFKSDVFAVFNLAAHVAGVVYNQSHHYEMFTKNLRVLSTPLKVAAEYGIPHFLQVSSVCVYSPDHNHPCLEPNGHLGLPTPANEGYSYAKRMGEHLARWTTQAGPPHTVIVRPSNIFGPRDHFDDRAHVIPALIQKALSDAPTIQAFGTGNESREFIYVTDVARGMLAALEHGQPGHAYNLGTNGLTCVAIHHLLDLIQQAAGTSKPVQFSSQHDPGDPARWSNAVKAAADLGWHYLVGLSDGLQRTVDWYKETQCKS